MKISTGENCPFGQVVLTKKECRTAARLVGLVYKGVRVSYRSYPAGCFFNTDGIAYFHNETNPSSTDPSSSYGAVCREGIILLLQYLIFQIL